MSSNKFISSKKHTKGIGRFFIPPKNKKITESERLREEERLRGYGIAKIIEVKAEEDIGPPPTPTKPALSVQMPKTPSLSKTSPVISEAQDAVQRAVELIKAEMKKKRSYKKRVTKTKKKTKSKARSSKKKSQRRRGGISSGKNVFDFLKKKK